MNSHALKDGLHASCTDNPTECVEVIGKFEDQGTQENYLQATWIMSPCTISDRITAIAKVALEQICALKVVICGLFSQGSKNSREGSMQQGKQVSKEVQHKQHIEWYFISASAE